MKFTRHQAEVVYKIQDLGGMTKIKKALDDISRLKVFIVGESIIDTYRFCKPESISSKSPSVSARFIREENYQGGSFAIDNHLQHFCTTMFSTPHLPCKKIRYLTEAGQRIFEITEIFDNPWEDKSHMQFCEDLLEKSRIADMSIVADFGHGLFEGPALQAAQELASFKALNVQTNSSNYGFNVYTKHRKFDYLSIDLREARLAHNDRYSSAAEIYMKVNQKAPVLSMTLGPDGALFSDSQIEKPVACPAFVENVVDATGAGDAYFALTSVLLQTDINREFLPFLGNVFAGLKTKIIGNKASVSKDQLIMALEEILG